VISLYISERTWLHRIPAGAKLLLLVAVTLLVTALEDLAALALAVALVGLIYASLPAAWLSAWRLARSLGLMLAIIFGIYLWSGQAEEGAAVMLHILCVVMLANLVTLTTPVDAMTRTLIPLFRPLAVFGVSPRRMALVIALAIRFVPLLFEQLAELTEAWRARSPKRPLWRIMAPFAARTLGTADRVAEALAARGGSEGFAQARDTKGTEA
jgi:biotin transport system permease protein